MFRNLTYNNTWLENKGGLRPLPRILGGLQPTPLVRICLCIYRIAPNFREIAENPIIENFRDKNFVIATFFREYH